MLYEEEKENADAIKSPWKGHKPKFLNADIVFCIDATRSMQDWIDAAKSRSKQISEDSIQKYPKINFQFGVIFYRDPIDLGEEGKNEFFPLPSNIDELVSFMNTQSAEGCGDFPEDWVGAYDILLNKFAWRKDAAHAIIHIADAPAHGDYWGGRGNYQEQGPLLMSKVHQIIQQDFFFSAVDINKGAHGTFEKIEYEYKQARKNDLYSYHLFDPSNWRQDSQLSAGDVLQDVTECQISAF